MKYLTQLLSATHQSSGFCCGISTLDTYLFKNALHEQVRRLEACFVITAKSTSKITGYYTLSNARIPLPLIPKTIQRKLPRSLNALPITLLEKIAVTETKQGQGLGSLLLIDALKRAYETSKTIGAFAVVVAPIDANTEQFFAHFGFVKLPHSQKMFLVMKTIKQLF